MRNFYAYLITLLIILFFQGLAYSASITWTGNGAGQTWGNPANWDCNCLPGMNDDVTIGDGSVPVYVNFAEFNVSINSLVLQNVELELQLDLIVLDFADIDLQSSITFNYYSSETYSILITEYLYFYGIVNVNYNNIPGEGTSLEVFDYGEVETDCSSNNSGYGIGDGFTVYHELFCEEYDDGYEIYFDFGPLEVYDIEYDNTSIDWVGEGEDNLWHNPANWSTGMVPGISDIAILNEDAVVVALQPITVKQVLIGINCTLEINGGLESEFYTWIDESAALTWKGGTLSRSNVNQQNIIFNYGEINIETAVPKRIENGLIIDNIAPSVFLFDYGKMNIYEDVVITTDGSNNALRNQGGEISIEGDNQSIVFDEIVNFGTIVKKSGSGISSLTSGDGVFTNYNDVKSSSGIFKIGSNIDNQGRLSGTGSFDFEFANGVSETLSGGITPGNSPGALIFVSSPELKSATFVMELNGTNPGTHYDQLNVLDDLVIDGGVLNVQKPSWYNPQDGDQYKLITSTGTISGAFDLIVYPDMSGNWSIAIEDQEITVSYGMLVPVELVDFSAKESEAGNFLEWKTASEINSQDFIIETSNNSVAWKTIGKVKSLGNESTVTTYNFLDRNTTAEIYYYRLKMRDLDGSYEYSKTVSLERKWTDQDFVIFPNPAGDIIRWNMHENLQEIQILGLDGTVVRNFKGKGRLDVSNLSPGMYFVSAWDMNGKQFNGSFIKK